MATHDMKPLALVTGASSGIGFELAKQFAENGFDLFICAAGADIDDAAQQLKAGGTAVHSLRADLRKRDEIDQLWWSVESHGRPVDAVALNAGVGVHGDFTETSLDDELDMIALNVTGVVQLAKLAARHMVGNGKGRLLFTASIAAIEPGVHMAVYPATKAFVYSFANGLHFELKNKGVSVTSLLPGPTDTNFFERADMLDTKVGQKQNKDDPADVARMGFEALMDGRRQVYAASWGTKMEVLADTILPEAAKAKMADSMLRPGSAKDGA
jgi:uncharacterized protein